jgi:hypothetical protein
LQGQTKMLDLSEISRQASSRQRGSIVYERIINVTTT